MRRKGPTQRSEANSKNVDLGQHFIDQGCGSDEHGYRSRGFGRSAVRIRVEIEARFEFSVVLKRASNSVLFRTRVGGVILHGECSDTPGPVSPGRPGSPGRMLEQPCTHTHAHLCTSRAISCTALNENHPPDSIVNSDFAVSSGVVVKEENNLRYGR